jgi:hypothetical protein
MGPVEVMIAQPPVFQLRLVIGASALVAHLHPSFYDRRDHHDRDDDDCG